MFHWKDKMHLHGDASGRHPASDGSFAAAARALAGADAGSQTADCADGRTDGRSDQRNHHMLLQPMFEQATSSCLPRHMMTHAGRR